MSNLDERYRRYPLSTATYHFSTVRNKTPTMWDPEKKNGQPKPQNCEGMARVELATLRLLDSRANQLRHTPLLSVETNAAEIDYKPP